MPPTTATILLPAALARDCRHPFYPIDSTIGPIGSSEKCIDPSYNRTRDCNHTCYHYNVIADTSSERPVTLCKLDPPMSMNATNQIVFGGGHSWPGGVRSPGSE